MSTTTSWLKRSQVHRYSEDDRTKQWKFEYELKARVDPFLSNPQSKSLLIGSYNMELEPWRMAAIASFRKFGVKVIEKKLDDLLEVTLVKRSKLQA